MGISTEPVPLNPKIFRPGSKLPLRTVSFVLNHGGLGDYLCALSALLWIARAHPQVQGNLYSPRYFMELAENAFARFPNWKVLDRNASLNDEAINAHPIYAPYHRPINTTGAHLLDWAFITYANTSPPPQDGNFYPAFDLSKVTSKLSPALGPYVVLTPGSTFPNRTMPPSTFNALVGAIWRRGLTPVFLGKRQMGERKLYFDDGYNLKEGIDLTDQTNLLEAALILSEARAVMGIDNGLLHLAACSEVPIVFGYTIASPVHREPRRPKGKIYGIHPDPARLTCTFCQSQMRFMFNHDFSKCMYDDLACLQRLENPAPWIELLDKALIG